MRRFCFLLAWVAFVPLFWAIARAKNLRAAVFYGWLAGFIAHVVGFHWLVYTINVFGGFPYSISTVVFLIYAALQGLEIAIFAFLVRGIGFGPWLIFPALFWVPIEFLFPLLFPWRLANSQSSFSWFIQTADLVGLYGASFLLMWCNAIVADVLFKKERGAKAQWVPAAVCSACIIASLIYGWVRLNQLTAQMKTATKLTVAAVQGNIAVGMKWDPKQMNANLDAHIKLTQEISGVQVILWPESAIEEWLPENLSALPAQFVESLRLKNAYFIFGARSYRGNPKGPDPKAFNTAFLTDPRGVVLGAVSQAGIARVRRVYSVLRAAWIIAWHAVRGRVYRRRRPAHIGLARRRKNRAADLLRRLDAGDIAELCPRKES